MAAARKIGQEYDITGTVQTVHIPVGDEEAGYTLINDGTSDIFWREICSPPLVPDGAAAVLIATPFFCSRLKPGEYDHQAGLDIYVVTDSAQQESSTLRVAPGRLYQSGDTDLATIADDIALLLAAGISALGEDMEDAVFDLAAGADQELIATPGAGHQLWIYGYELHAGPAQGTIALLSATTSKTGTMQFGAGGGVVRDSVYPIFKCGTAEALNLTAVTCTADGNITYRDVTL